MEQIKVFHCSPDKISEFDFSYGVHFGGIASALEAGIRKSWNVSNQDLPVYIHTCTLSIPSKIIISDDVGCNSAWQRIASEEMIGHGINVLKYENKYEPDTVPSWYVLSHENIILEDIQEISMSQAERILESAIGESYLGFNY